MSTPTMTYGPEPRAIGAIEEPQWKLDARADEREGAARDYNSKMLRYELVNLDWNYCQVSGNQFPFEKMQVSHDVAWGLGGSDEIWNLFLACGHHNRSMQQMRLAEARRQPFAKEPCSSGGRSKTAVERKVDLIDEIKDEIEAELIDENLYPCNICGQMKKAIDLSGVGETRADAMCRQCKRSQNKAYTRGICCVQGCEQEIGPAAVCSEHYPDWRNFDVPLTLKDW